MDKVSTKNAEHYHWGENQNPADGWHLVESPSLSVIQERMPPGSKEVMHYHNKAEQFFFVLSGVATMKLENKIVELTSHQGLHIPAGVAHQMMNCSDEPLVFTVTSTPPSHGDRNVI